MYIIHSYNIKERNPLEELETLGVSSAIDEHISKYNGQRKMQSAAGIILAVNALRPLSAELKFLENGKPVASKEGVYLSITHSGKYAFCAISDCCVGIDAEQIIIKKDYKRITEILPPSEKRYVLKNKENFAKVWTAKEALSKISGNPVKNCLKEQIFDENGKIVKRDYKFNFENHFGYKVCICEKINKL